MSPEISGQPPIPKSKLGEPTWEIATHLPNQGDWSEGDYLRIAHQRGVELVSGVLEFLPMPTEFHQIIVAFLFDSIRRAAGDNGITLFSGLRVKTRPDKIREPDLVFMFHQNRSKRSNAYWSGADLVMEVVSRDDPSRDKVTKLAEYAEAGIPEYWIVNPIDRSVTQLVLDQSANQYTANQYSERGRFVGGKIITSAVLEKLQLSANQIFNRPEALEGV